MDCLSADFAKVVEPERPQFSEIGCILTGGTRGNGNLADRDVGETCREADMLVT